MSDSWVKAARRRWFGCGLGLVALLAASLPVPVSAGAADDPTELERTWQAAWVYLPGAAHGRVLRIGELGGEMPAPSDARYPTVVYLHGCAGLNYIANETGAFLAEAGYAVIMPDSFARADKPKSCDPVTLEAGLHRAVLGWRQAEAMHALSSARGLSWVNGDRLFLMGLSEGAITVATVPAAGVRARIVEGWTCHAGWPEYHGLNAPADEPVLSLVGREDPWFRLPVLQGECGAFMTPDTGSRSIVYRPPHALADDHYLSWHADARGAILDFLNLHSR